MTHLGGERERFFVFGRLGAFGVSFRCEMHPSCGDLVWSDGLTRLPVGQVPAQEDQLLEVAEATSLHKAYGLPRKGRAVCRVR